MPNLWSSFESIQRNFFYHFIFVSVPLEIELPTSISFHTLGMHIFQSTKESRFLPIYLTCNKCIRPYLFKELKREEKELY